MEFKTYKEWSGREADFYIRYRIIPESEGGSNRPVLQHIRWDWVFEGIESDDNYAMIWPEFLNPDGTVYPPDQPIPTEGVASMWIVNEPRRSFHLARVAIGVRGYCMEGPRRVASAGIVPAPNSLC
jgi:hypothetical protein